MSSVETERGRAALYCRLSKEDADRMDNSESIRNQRLLLTDFARSQNFGIYRVYIDDDYSGLDKNRPSFRRMLKDAEKGLFDVIICKNQSRFTRDMELVEKYLHGLFAVWGIRFIGVTDNVDTNARGNKKARQINGLINEWYSEDLSDNIRAVFRRKMEDGQFIGPFACYGYEKAACDRHRLVADAEAACVVREIFSLYLAGNGAARIAQILTAKGVLTPSAYKAAKGLRYAVANCAYCEKYGAWSVSTVKKILRNEVYIGSLVQGRERKLSYKSTRVVAVPKDEWVVIKNSHEPIVDEKTFYTVQSLIESRRTGRSVIKGAYKPEPHLLAAKVRCLDCGGAMQRSGTTRDKLSSYLRCATANRTGNARCTPHCIRQDRLERLLERRIRELAAEAIERDSGTIAARVIGGTGEEQNIQIIKRRQLAEAEEKLKGVTKALAACYADKVNGLITEDEFVGFRQSLGEERQAYINKKANLEQEIAACEQRLKGQANLDTLLEARNPFNTLSHAVINEFLDYIQVGERDHDTGEQEVVINWLF